MKNTKKKISKIVDELITYLFSMSATDISINIKERDDFFVITLSCDYHKNQEDKLNKLVKALDAPSEENIEEYYWELTGGSTSDTELSLIGMMIENFEVSVVGDSLTLTLYKKK